MNPFRIFPAKAGTLPANASPQQACHACLSGTCCSSEDPIILTAFDVLRLATFFNLSPAEFLLRFTQDRFAGEDSETKRRPYLDDPNSSTVTWLRRRANLPSSPCIFLTYIKEADGTPRRVCGVHEARPLACREYYFDTCRTRWTGELATLQADGYEQIREGQITPARVENELARLGPVDPDSAPMSLQMDFAFWIEMRRALDIEAANTEGANSYDITLWQDPIHQKLNRLLSRTWLRFEEKYGLLPSGEQLHPYSAGLSFAESPHRQRLLNLSQQSPSQAPLFGPGDYPHYVAARISLLGLKPSRKFPSLPARALRQQSAKMRSALEAANSLVHLAASLSDLPLERELLFATRRIEAMNPAVWSLHPGLAAVATWADSRTSLPASWQRRLRRKPTGSRALRLHTQNSFGLWHTDPRPGPHWPESQSDYWCAVIQSSTEGIVALAA